MFNTADPMPAPGLSPRGAAIAYLVLSRCDCVQRAGYLYFTRQGFLKCG